MKALAAPKETRHPNDAHRPVFGFQGDIHALGWVVVALTVGVDRYKRHILAASGSKDSVWTGVATSNTSSTLLEFLRRMTHEAPDQRPSLYDICRHPCEEKGKALLGEDSIYESESVKDDLSAMNLLADMYMAELAATINVRPKFSL